MKTPIQFFVVVALLATSCSYQYATVSSDLNQPDNSGFVAENDSVRITYSFSGNNCPVIISVFNKSEKPLYIDWRKCAVIVDGESFSFWKDETVLNAQSKSSEFKWSTTYPSTTTTTTTEGTLTRNESITFIPPRSKKEVSMISIRKYPFKFAPDEKPEKIKLQSTTIQLPATIRYYDAENTPLRYRSYITLSFDDKFETSFAFQNEFWVSEIIQTGATPKSIPDIGLAANTFHIEYVPK